MAGRHILFLCRSTLKLSAHLHASQGRDRTLGQFCRCSAKSNNSVIVRFPTFWDEEHIDYEATTPSIFYVTLRTETARFRYEGKKYQNTEPMARQPSCRIVFLYCLTTILGLPWAKITEICKRYREDLRSAIWFARRMAPQIYLINVKPVRALYWVHHSKSGKNWTMKYYTSKSR